MLFYYFFYFFVLKAKLLMKNYDCLNWRRERLCMLSTQMRGGGGGGGGGVILN